MRKTVEDRITTLRRKTIVRPRGSPLRIGRAGRAGSLGPASRERDGQRMNAVLRFLFAAVIIDEHRGKRGTFDYRTSLALHLPA